MNFSLMGLIIPSGNTPQLLIKESIIIIFFNYIKHVNTQGTFKFSKRSNPF